MQSSVEDKLFIYKPMQDDPIDRNLANYINKAPLRLRSKMQFEREAPGIYRFARKKVFMKIEGETIVIRVGGGYRTIEEFLAQNCGIHEDELQKKRITNLVYAGQCAGNKDFKTFYMSHTVEDMNDENGECNEAEDARVMIERAGKSPLKGGSNTRINFTTNPSTPNNCMPKNLQLGMSSPGK